MTNVRFWPSRGVIIGTLASAVFVVLGYVFFVTCGFDRSRRVCTSEHAMQLAFDAVKRSRYAKNLPFETLDDLKRSRADCCYVVRSRIGKGLFRSPLWYIRFYSFYDVQGHKHTREHNVNVGGCGVTGDVLQGS